MDVVLVLGRGESEEEAKLGEALGLAYLEAAFRSAEPTAEVVVLNAVIDPRLRHASMQGEDDAVAAAQLVKKWNPTLCGISLIYRPQREWAARFVRELRRLRCRSHIAVGGMYPTSAWQHILDALPEIDSVCVGEGDHVAVDLYRALATGGDWRAVGSLAWRDGRGTPTTSLRSRLGQPVPARVPREAMGSLPFPSRSQLPQVLALGGVAQVEASRGCDAGCTFCDARHTAWRPRPVEHVVDELELLVTHHPNALVYFIDNVFLGFSTDGSHLRRGQALAREILERKLNLRFAIQDRAANVDRETFAQLQRAGLCEVYIGIESFADSALRALRKGADTTAETNQRALATLGELRLYTQFGFLPFHESTTLQELATTIANLRAAIGGNQFLHVSNFNEVIPYEGTYLERRYREEHRASPPAANPWNYADTRVFTVRDWIWRFSGALWPVTGLVFHAIQKPEFQKDLWRTLPAKNDAFVGFAEWLLEQVMREESCPRQEDIIENEYEAAVQRTVSAVAATLDEWADDAARGEMLRALSRVDPYEPLAWELSASRGSERESQSRIVQSRLQAAPKG